MMYQLTRPRSPFGAQLRRPVIPVIGLGHRGPGTLARMLIHIHDAAIGHHHLVASDRRGTLAATSS
jgi:hypothetical protein